MSGMTITFGLHQNDADWSDKQAALGEIHLGPEGMISLLQTHLGLGGVDENAAIRIEQYRKRMEAVNSDNAWFHKSFELDTWSTAKQLLNWRDELIFAGWDGKPLPAGISKRLDALSEIENKNKQVPLVKGTAEKLLEVLNEIDYLDVSCIKSIQLTEPLELLPYLWQKVFEKLKDVGVTIEEPQLQTPNINIENKSLVLLEADTEWEAAEALAMWLAADVEKNGEINMIVPDNSPALSAALHRMGLPRIGSSVSSKWRSYLQILPSVFANAWEPIDLGALVSLLSLPNSPVPRSGTLLRALRKEAGVKGEEWNKAIERIKEKYRKEERKTSDEVDKMLAQIDEMLVTDRYSSSGISEDAVIKRCNWIIKSLSPKSNDEDKEFLKKPIHHAMTLKKLVEGRSQISRVELERMIDSLINEESIGNDAEAAPWHITSHPGGISTPRPILVWWNFINKNTHATSYWNNSERDALNKINIKPDELGMAQKREVFAWKNAIDKTCEKIILIRPKTVCAEETARHQLWDMITASDGGKNTAQKYISKVSDVFYKKETSELFGRKIKSRKIIEIDLPQGQDTYTIPEKLELVKRRKSTSYTNIEHLISCPFKWVLEETGIKPSVVNSLPNISSSIGTLCHRIVEDIFVHSKRSWLPEDARLDAENRFDKMIGTLYIELCAEDRALEKERYKNNIGQAIFDLAEFIKENNYKTEGAEVKIEGNICEFPLEGRIDLLLKDKNDKTVVVDLKWTNKADERKNEIDSGQALQLATYIKLLEDNQSDIKASAGYFILPRNRWLDADQEKLREVFSRAEYAWKEELDKLNAGTVTKGREDAQKNKDKNNTDSGTETFKIDAYCKYCDYNGLCKPNVNKTDSTEDDVE